MDKIWAIIIFSSPVVVLFFSVWGACFAKKLNFLYIGFAILCLPFVVGEYIWYFEPIDTSKANYDLFAGMGLFFAGPFAAIGVLGFFLYMAVLGFMYIADLGFTQLMKTKE
ncbi:MAG: hypothetical protein ABJK39_06510 [Hyphomicrobiales bacterium]